MDEDYRTAASISHCYFADAKYWFYVSLLLKAGIFVVGAFTVFVSLLPEAMPLLVGALSIASEISRWRSDDRKSEAEKLKRQLEEHDGFGWNVSKVDLADIMAKCPQRYLTPLTEQQLAGSTFASKATVGPQRVVVNLTESSFWSKHLADFTAKGLTWIIIALFAFAVVTLIISVKTVGDLAVLGNIAKVVTSTLVLGFSLGLVRLRQSYSAFAQKAGAAEQKGETLLKGNIETVEAVRALASYQLARASAPLIPTFVWSLKEKRLNEIWKFRTQPTPAP